MTVERTAPTSEASTTAAPTSKPAPRRAARAAAPPFSIVTATVDRVERISPNFIRVTFAGDALRSVGNPGQTLDQRVKLIFPPASGTLPELETGPDWHLVWGALPEEARGAMRTYSIRDITVAENGDTSIVIDFVAHLTPGATGPASLWASQATQGDVVLLVAPHRGRVDGGGIEFQPDPAATVVLAGDETAAPAIARVLEDLPLDARGIAFIEIPEAADAVPISPPAGITVRWLPRDSVPHGELLHAAVAEYAATVAQDSDRAAASAVDLRESSDPEVLVWETPDYSGAGETISEPTTVDRAAEYYFWIAGESGVVTGLRRHLVKGLGISRHQVAFMGYWRIGVAMRG